MTTALVVQLMIALAVALVASAVRARVGGIEGLALFGVALALATPWPYAAVVLVAGLAFAAWMRVEHARRERERTTVGKFLAQIEPSVSLERPSFPPVRDEIAMAALAAQERRETEFALRMAPPIEPPKARPAPGVRARFMAAMGHELRSPLNSITGFAQLLEDGSEGPLNDAQRENVVLVRRAAEELLTLLTDILDAARIESGRVRLDRQWTAPVEVLTQALDRVRDSTEGDPMPVDVQLQPGLSPLMVDRSRLGQALYNVLRAVGRKPGLVARVRELPEGGQLVVRFEVLDRSRPLSESDAARAFDPDPAARPEGRSLSLGLALSVARDLAQMHGGGARAEPLDGGTNWVVWVPATPPEPRRGRSASPARMGAVRERR